MGARGCIFCRSTTNKMSNEHLFRESFREHIPHSPHLGRYDYNPTGKLRQLSIPVSAFDMKVGGVCKQCNESWMNDLDAAVERDVLALARDGALEVPSHRHADLAAWATKVALMRAEANRSYGWHPSEHLFDEFYRTQRALPASVVRVGHLTQLLKEGGSHGFAQLIAPEQETLPETQRDRVTMHVVEWGMGSLFVHVILLSDRRNEDALVDVDALTEKTAGPALRRIWPETGRRVRLVRPVSRGLAARVGNLSHLLVGDPLDSSDYGYW